MRITAEKADSLKAAIQALLLRKSPTIGNGVKLLLKWLHVLLGYS